MADGEQRIAEHIRAWLNAEEPQALTRTAGFDVENASIHGFRWCFASAEALSPEVVRLAFLDSWRALVPDEARREVFRRLGETLDREALRLENPLHLHTRAPEVTVVPRVGNPCRPNDGGGRNKRQVCVARLGPKEAAP